MSAYYNEIDQYAAAWLRNLISAGLIAPGDVDERSIVDVKPAEIVGYKQCHFFAGIGVWSYALRRAGWSDDRHVWTGSCPCQPFSEAGKGLGFADERHLWPSWFHLIEQRRPSCVFGEQSASKGARFWLDLVQTDMEARGYAFGSIIVPAAGFGAPHGRHRAWFVADANGRDASAEGIQRGREYRQQPKDRGADFWKTSDWIKCTDGKDRPIEPGTLPLAHGLTERMGRLRAYGNAIVPQVAEAFIKSYLSAVA